MLTFLGTCQQYVVDVTLEGLTFCLVAKNTYFAAKEKLVNRSCAYL